MKKMRFGKKAAAWVLAAAMVLSVIPSSKLTMSAYAEEENGAQIQETVSEEVPETSEAENEAPEVEPETSEAENETSVTEDGTTEELYEEPATVNEISEAGNETSTAEEDAVNENITVSIASPKTILIEDTLQAKVELFGNELSEKNYQYQWYRVGAAGEEIIDNATEMTYKVTAADAKKRLKVKVSSKDGKFIGEAVTENKVDVKVTIRIAKGDPRSKIWDNKTIEPKTQVVDKNTGKVLAEDVLTDEEEITYSYYTYGQVNPLKEAPTDAGIYYIQAIIRENGEVKETSPLTVVSIKLRPNEGSKPSKKDWIYVENYNPSKTYECIHDDKNKEIVIPIADPNENQLRINTGLGKTLGLGEIKPEDITLEWYEGEKGNLIDSNHNWNDSVRMVDKPKNAGTYTLVAYVPSKAKIILGQYSIHKAVPKCSKPYLTGSCGDLLGSINFPGGRWSCDYDPGVILREGDTVEVTATYMPTDLDNYISVTYTVTVDVKPNFEKLKKYIKPTSKKAGRYAYYRCKNCGGYHYYNGKTKKWKKEYATPESLIIPAIPSTKAVVMGNEIDASQLITDGREAFTGEVSVDEAYEKYLTVDGRKLCPSKTFTQGLNTVEVPVTIGMKDAKSETKSYTVKIKIVPNITIKKSAINGGAKYRYDFKYNFADTGATKVRVTLKNSNSADANRYLAERISGMTNNNSYLIVADWKLRQLGGSLTFKITISYGNNEEMSWLITK